jgi:ATP-dependent Lon protease
MDVIHLSGYTEEEKFAIARRYLVPKQLEAHGLAPSKAPITDAAIRVVIREHTREAGVRSLERQLAALCRKAALEIAEGRRKRLQIGDRRVREWLGPRRFAGEIRKRTSDPGVATGLAVTPVGGDVLFIEATGYPGRGRLKVTGQLGDVMQESAQAAHSWAWSRAEELGLDPLWFAENDVHVHVPAGAQPKDGPSAGVAIATAIVSIASGRPVSSDIAMTGEITLTGQVLQIGGVREKTLAAARAGVKRVVLPRENEPDLVDVPEEISTELEFVLADTVEQVLEVAFDGSLPARRRRAQALPGRKAASAA